MSNVPPIRKLKRAVIKEEFVALTGDMTKAVILNQFVYWSERIWDVDRFISEERERMEKYSPDEINVEPQAGWIYKKAEDLSAETMIGLAKSNIRSHVKALVNAGWLLERRNPKYAWDRTMQYRVDFVRLRRDLLAIGYDLDGYIFDEAPANTDSNYRSSDIEPRNCETNLQTTQNESALPKINNKDLKIDRLIEARANEESDHHETNPIHNPEPSSSASTEILRTLSASLRQLYVNDTASLYDHYFDDIYAALCRQFPECLEPEIVRRAADIYRSRTIDERTFERKLTVHNPVGLFIESYKDATAGHRAAVFKADKVGYG